MADKLVLDKVYIVTEGSYSDYHICGVFTYPALAERMVERFGSNIEVYSLNEWSPGMNAYLVGLMQNGDVIKVVEQDEINFMYYEYKIEDDQVNFQYSINPTKTAIHTYVFARDEQHAIKIANERRQQLIALGKWNEGTK